MNFKFNDEEKPIILKEGNNIPLITGMCITVVIFIALITSKLWLPDGRNNMTNISRTDMFFTNCTLTLQEKTIIKNLDTNLCQIEFTDLGVIDDSKDKEYVFNVKNENEIDLPFALIKGNSESTEESSVLKTHYILQIAVPKDFYYTTINIKKNGMEYTLRVDYRDYKNDSSLVELSKDYLLQLEGLQKNKSDLEKEYKALETQKKQQEEQLKQQTDETMKVTIQATISDIDTRLRAKEIEINTVKDKIVQLTGE